MATVEPGIGSAFDFFLMQCIFML